MREELKKVIKLRGTLKDFAEQNGIRRATLSDFLNGKTDIQVSTLEKIMNGAGLEIAEANNVEPGKFIECESVKMENGVFNKGTEVRIYENMFFTTGGETHVIHSCFTYGDRHAVVLENLRDKNLELKVL